MSNLKSTFVDQIVEHCLNSFYKLPKTGKPVENEWTVLSCILQYDNSSKHFEMISLATGSKCIGASKMSPLGDIMNDSHAEIFARRGFLIYLYENIDKCMDNKESIFLYENEKFKLKENIEFIFYSSQLPCGDASILPKNDSDEDFGDVIQSNKRQAQSEICDSKNKKQKLSNDIHRTGAKCLPHSEQDLKESGLNYHLLGQVRTKPGRGDRTLSVSCSDKIAKWVHLGIQGRLLDLFLDKPIFISDFIFGSGVPYSEKSLTRALLYRDNKSSIMLEYMPKFHQTSVLFPHIKTEKNRRPAPGSIIWIKSEETILEVAVHGRKLGVTKKKAKLLNSTLCISKYNLYKRFQNILHKNEELQQMIVGKVSDVIPYNKMKAKSKRYEENWQFLKHNFFKTWTVKPDIWDFCVHVT